MEKLRCAILDDYQNVALTMANWSIIQNQVEITLFSQHIDQEKELIQLLAPYDIVVLMRERTKMGASILKHLPNLKLLITTGMRNAAIDIVAATALGVVVCGTRSLSYPPAELTWALILGLARNLVQENQSFRTNGLWQSSVGTDLYQKQLGLLGLGKIGSLVARIGIAFGMKVVAFSQNLTRQKAEESLVSLADSKEELLEQSDFVSIHLVLSDRTKGFIGKPELRRMKKSAYLINTSRAQIVDQVALIKALDEKWIAGAAIDVFEEEPLSPHHIFRSLPNLLATPHLGYVSKENYQVYYQEIIENIQEFLQNAPIRRLV